MRFAAAQALIAEAIETRASPAVVIEVGRGADVLWQHAAGALTYEPGAQSTTIQSVFDLASLTKVVATTSLVMRLVQHSALDVDAPAGAFLSQGGVGLPEAIRIRHLLDHSSGLPGRVRLWEQASGRSAYLAAISAVPLQQSPGVAAVYSDLGFILLGLIVEQVGARSLDEQFAALAQQWGEVWFTVPRGRAEDVVPTEIDPWRGRLLCGEVHDENAAALGGVAGHAGLFGTAPAVGAFARDVLRTFRIATVLGTPALMHTFSEPSAVPGSSRALGWDTMRPTSSCGTRMSGSAIGHTGFTGTSVWIDRQRDVYIVLLANRVHPTRENERWLAWRPRIHDAVMSEFGD